MIDRKECPECGGTNTERVHVTWNWDRVTEVRICDDCPLQYEAVFAEPITRVTMKYHE